MIISNIRFGFAANSSSSHSVVILPPGASLNDDPSSGQSFGWGEFVLSSKLSKSEYVAVQIRNAVIQQTKSEYLANLVVKDLFHGNVELADDADIDHQSHWGIPVDRKGCLHVEFAEQLRDYITQENVAILGGNDNDGVTPFTPEGTTEDPVTNILSAHGSNLLARQDGDWWTLFNQRSGMKVRFSFKKNPPPFLKAKTPDLCDIKCTDFCPFGCAFCYQSSDTDGKHAPLSTLTDIAYHFGQMGVFEVALGGGEPTMHPDFLQILQAFRNHGVVPNFTTKDATLFNDTDRRERIMAVAGAMAYSVAHQADAYQYAEFRKEYSKSGSEFGNKYKAHLVMGSKPLAELVECAKILDKAYIDVVLLGFKRTGRGIEFPAHPYDGWIEAFQAAKLHRIGIDTALAFEYQQQLNNLGQQLLFHVQEGAYSAYIDAVAGTVAPSSYCDKSQFQTVMNKGFGGPYFDSNLMKKAFDSFPGA